MLRVAKHLPEGCFPTKNAMGELRNLAQVTLTTDEYKTYSIF